MLSMIQLKVIMHSPAMGNKARFYEKYFCQQRLIGNDVGGCGRAAKMPDKM